MFSICYICFKLYLSQDELVVHFDEEHKVNLVLKQFLRFKKKLFSLSIFPFQDMPNKSIHSPLFNKETKEFFCNGCNKYTEAKKSLMGFLVHNLICTKTFYTVNIPLKCISCQESFSVFKNFKVFFFAYP